MVDLSCEEVIRLECLMQAVALKAGDDSVSSVLYTAKRFANYVLNGEHYNKSEEVINDN